MGQLVSSQLTWAAVGLPLASNLASNHPPLQPPPATGSPQPPPVLGEQAGGLEGGQWYQWWEQQTNQVGFPGEPRSCVSGKGQSTGSKMWEERGREKAVGGAPTSLEGPSSPEQKEISVH